MEHRGHLRTIKQKAPRLLKKMPKHKSANNLQSQTKSNQVSAHIILSIEKTELLEPKYNKYLNPGFSVYFSVMSHVVYRVHGQQTGILALRIFTHAVYWSLTSFMKLQLVIIDVYKQQLLISNSQRINMLINCSHLQSVWEADVTSPGSSRMDRAVLGWC